MSEARFSFTTKLGGDLLTVRGDSIEEFDKNVAELSTASPRSLHCKRQCVQSALSPPQCLRHR